MRAMFAAPMLASQCTLCGGGGAAPTLAPIADQAFLVPAGAHDSVPGWIDATRVQTDLDRFLSFRAMFHEDTAYATVDPANQWDWNKLMGLTTVNIHGDSVRLGWRYAPDTDRVELGAYAYVDGVRVDEENTDVARGAWFDVSMSWTEDTIQVTVDGETVEIDGPHAGIPRTTWALTSAYFGGDEVAPHDMHVDVTDVWTDL